MLVVIGKNGRCKLGGSIPWFYACLLLNLLVVPLTLAVLEPFQGEPAIVLLERLHHGLFGKHERELLCAVDLIRKCRVTIAVLVVRGLADSRKRTRFAVGRIHHESLFEFPNHLRSHHRWPADGLGCLLGHGTMVAPINGSVCCPLFCRVARKRRRPGKRRRVQLQV